MWSDELNKNIVEQKFLIVNEYNAIVRKINEIHDTSIDSNRRSVMSSTYHKDYLMNKLNNIQRIYGISNLDDRNKQLELLNNQINEYNKLLADDIATFSRDRHNANIPENLKDAMAKHIIERRKFSNERINDMRNIKFASFTPTSTTGQSNLRF